MRGVSGSGGASAGVVAALPAGAGALSAVRRAAGGPSVEAVRPLQGSGRGAGAGAAGAAAGGRVMWNAAVVGVLFGGAVFAAAAAATMVVALLMEGGPRACGCRRRGG